MADDAEGRQDHDVDLRVTKKPEDVLEHHRVTTTRRIKEAGAKVAVCQCHGDGASQNRHHRN